MSKIMQNMQPDEFDQVFSIMERSFSKDEYRTYEEQKQLLEDGRYHIYVMHQAAGSSGHVQAFLSVWQFEQFAYIEHFAAEPEVRGQGLGSRILQEAVQRFPGQICLEVELPETDMAKRRIAFYERNGFYLNSYPYMQPSISKGKQELPLMVMTYGEGVSKERFAAIRNTLYQEVYKQDESFRTVYQAKESDVRKFLTALLRQDEKLFLRFKLMADHSMGLSDIDRYKKQVDDILQKYMEKDRYIPYKETFEFAKEIQQILEQEVRMMMENGYFAQANLLVCHIFTSVWAADMDDSNGTKGTLAFQCASVWKEIETHADSRLRRQMYEWLTARMGQAAGLEESLEQVFLEAFSGDDFLNEKLAFTKQKAQEQKADADSWSARYETQKWALYHIRLLEQSGSDFSEIAAYCKEFWEYAQIRQYYAKQCILKKQYEEAAAVLLESIAMDAGTPGRVRQFRMSLKEVYRMSGRQQDYRQQLWQLLTKDDPGNPEVFHEFKSLYAPQEWEKVREEVFQALPKQARVDRLYKEEALYDRLLAYVLAQKGLYALQQYEDVLKEAYPRQLLEKYTQELTDMVQRAADRRHYQEWAAHLKRMTQIAGGQEEVQKIVSDWRVRYKNRPAMIEELKQF